MSWLLGALALPQDSSRELVNTIGQAVVYKAVSDHLDQLQVELDTSSALFVEETTDNYTERYFLPGGGRMQKTGLRSPAAAVKAEGGWNTAYPLHNFTDSVAKDKITLAYMTIADYQRHVDNITVRYLNTYRYEMVRAMLNATNETFTDVTKGGDLTIRRFANNDGSIFPPAFGSETERTTLNQYVGSNYTAANISDTNNPIRTIVRGLEANFGKATGGSPIVIFHHEDQTDKLIGLSGFIDFQPYNVRPGSGTDVISLLHPKLDVPGASWKIIGTYGGAYICEWPYIPTSYMMGVHLQASGPLKMRVDPSYTRLPAGLTLEATDEQFPLMSDTWRARFGFGVGNRLNGFALQLVASTSYTTPAEYA